MVKGHRFVTKESKEKLNQMEQLSLEIEDLFCVFARAFPELE